ncbi:MAG: T9SS type A sorting domain-containing protein [Bacteroidota bacterium]|nr:T9SS type A sorting domain-containing protein [Bacteroidota bacterium]
MKTLVTAVTIVLLLGWLCFCPSVRSQTPSTAQTIKTDLDVDETEAVLEEELVDDDAVNMPVLYTMTSGTFETGGRVLLFSASNAAVASMLNQDQAEKSSLSVTPQEYALAQNYPNPFNPITTVQFDLPEQALVTLKIYNVLGQEVVSLLDNELLDEGNQEVELNAQDLSSGVYFYRIAARGIDEDDIQTSTFNSVKKMLLLR